MDNSTRFYMLRGVQQHADYEHRCLIFACEILQDDIKEKNPKCAEELHEMLKNPEEFETKFREFVAAYTACFYEKESFKNALKHFSEYQRTRKALKILW